MLKTAILMSLMFWSLTLYGQNELTETQCQAAIKEASGSIGLGIGLTAAGGLIAFLASKKEVASTTGLNNLGNRIGNELVLLGGIGLALVGVSTFIYSSVQQDHYRKLLAKFPAKVTWSPQLLHENNHYAMGLSVAFRF
jgi:hypothetical protein